MRGCYPRWAGPTTSQFCALDIKRLRQQMDLDRDGAYAYVRWNNGTHAQLERRAGALEMRFTITAEGRTAVVTRGVMLDYSQQHMGGCRMWLRCPRCHTRRGVLYLTGHLVQCRKCADLKYSSQREGRHIRGHGKVASIRRRLGWPAGILNETGGKPKGMWWRTYWRLTAQHQQLLEQAFMGWRGWLDSLQARRKGF